MSILLVAGMAALVSRDANASGPFSLYPPGTRALARPEVASALAVAQSILRRYQYGLKIWDAYRPAAVQANR